MPRVDRPPRPNGLATTLVLSAALVAAIAVAALFVPLGWRGAATLATATVVLLAAYVWRPKPALLVFATLVLFYDTIARWLGTPSLRQVDEAVLPFILFIAAWRLRPWRRALIEPVRDGAVAALAVAGIASSVINGVPIGVWLPGLLLMFKVIAFLYIVLWHDFSLDDVRQFVAYVAAVAVVVLALSVPELIDPIGYRETLNLTSLSVPRGQLPSIKSIFFHPVLFSWFTAFVGLFLLAAYTVYRRWWLLGAGLLFGIGTMLSGRRRAIIGLLVGLAGGFANRLGEWNAASRGEMVRRWGPVFAGIALVGLAFLPGLIGLFALTVDEAGPDPDAPAGNARLALYRGSAEIARDFFPLGGGLGRFGSGISRTEYSPLYERYGLDEVVGLGPDGPNFITDAFWPHILGETGVIGLAAYLVFVGAVGLSLWRAARRNDVGPFARAFLLGAWMVFLHALVETLASSMFNSPPRVYLLFAALGVALSLERSRALISEEISPPADDA